MLMLVPANTLVNWGNEIVKWTGDLPSPLQFFNLGEANKHYYQQKIKEWQQKGGIIFMSEALFRRWCKVIALVKIDVLVLDEAHTMLKNSATKVSKELQKIKTKRRILLTGTPLQNNVTEFYQLVDFVRPGAIDGAKSQGAFEAKYR